ncbi:hypothetical protein ILUMI_27308 [Ignelater luminosus]|uniref:PiggyBac transposable element-derived protein domain-containing protein n=1 Tax=Ignelater luminosus TaxID=2038154 RepID=A0A8K0FVP3_IGNLU|nr:hypothetical protein ILUMI_27308 [Ignelater luminosus]
MQTIQTNNLPGAQLRAEAEAKKQKEIKNFNFIKDDNDTILNFTNVCAQQRNGSGDVTVAEFYCLIGALLSGYCSVPRKRMYWENLEDTHSSPVSNAIFRDRFQHIMNNLHCNDNDHLDEDHRFSKVRPLFDSSNEKFLQFTPMTDNHCVPYYGQFIRGKPIRWEYKFWVGATSFEYIVHFESYQGSST